MPVLTYPTSIIVSALRFQLETNTGSFESPLSKTVQTIERAGAGWKADLTYNKLSEANHRTLKAFIASLAGRAGRFYLYDIGDGVPQGPAGGSPLVAGASQTGKTLTVDGLTFSITSILKAGDYFSVVTPSGVELKLLTADANSDGAGASTFTFEPALRESPADNAVITTTNAPVIMMLEDDNSFSWQAHPGRTYSWRISCREAIVP